VISDLLGLSDKPVPKFVKKYATLSPIIKEALAEYKNEVESGAFPNKEQTY
jgi:3-methyl-2-oxobutanoate hydroxymethyltransferase